VPPAPPAPAHVPVVDDVDVLVVGAGISGIGAAYRLKTECPDKTWTILEARDAMGGTWDLFRYPGIRSDSDMFTLGFPWRPWTGDASIADGADILAYVEASAREHGIDRAMRFGHRVAAASWSTPDARWTVEVERTGAGARTERVAFRCGFLFMCSGYYDYSGGYTPELPGIERFRGRVVHPQRWTPDIAYAGKRVVVIGSGATAVGLVPAVARDAAHVTMLQRSPTYMLTFPKHDAMSRWLARRTRPKVTDRIMRVRNTAMASVVYSLSKRFPGRAKKLLIRQVKAQITADVDVDPHFTPHYGPWDQRLCLVRDGDFFEAINSGKADVVTDTIDTFTEGGIRLASGRELEADLVVTATGLRILLLAGIPFVVDGAPVEVSKHTMYKGTMLDGVPNMAVSLGYVNASWTLRADLIARYVCRVLRAMDRKGRRVCVPRFRPGEGPSDETVFQLDSGYVKRAKDRLPRQGKKKPWANVQAYLPDLVALGYGRVDDGVLRLE
jgi:cation diffusion facilitator CzcD-associated flavoprotein CzcO